MTERNLRSRSAQARARPAWVAGDGPDRCRHTRQSMVAAFLALAALQPGAASAQSLSCGGRLFGVGDSRLAVLQQCGEPMLKESICIPRAPEWVWAPSSYPGAPAQQVLVQQCTPMEDWVYYRGPGNFVSIARFSNGVIESARDGGRAN